MADTAQLVNTAELEELHNNRASVHFLAIARANTPELAAIEQVANALGAHATQMTPDLKDIHSLVKSTAKAPIAVAVTGEGTRWAEAGWWLVPLLVLSSLASFQRVEQRRKRVATQ